MTNTLIQAAQRHNFEEKELNAIELITGLHQGVRDNSGVDVLSLLKRAAGLLEHYSDASVAGRASIIFAALLQKSMIPDCCTDKTRQPLKLDLEKQFGETSAAVASELAAHNKKITRFLNGNDSDKLNTFKNKLSPPAREIFLATAVAHMEILLGNGTIPTVNVINTHINILDIFGESNGKLRDAGHKMLAEPAGPRYITRNQTPKIPPYAFQRTIPV